MTVAGDFGGKLVVVSMRSDYIPDRNEFRDSVDRALIDILVMAGCFPVLVPNIVTLRGQSKYIMSWLSSINPDGILLSGGGNFGDSKNRDAVENTLLEFSISRLLPVLGICRGMQAMGLYFGGSLTKVRGHVSTTHALKFDNKIYSFPELVNSYHDFAFVECPKNFEICAVSDDGIIEAIKHVNLPWLGLMWHPERDGDVNPINLQIIKNLFLGER